MWAGEDVDQFLGMSDAELTEQVKPIHHGVIPMTLLFIRSDVRLGMATARWVN